jgi:transposase-like protein
MIYRQRISNYKLKKIIHHFCIDIDATKTSQLIGFNRNTVNSYFLLFRKAIYHYQTLKSKKLRGTVEVDESYFGAKRVRGRHGKLKRGRGTQKQPVFGIIQRKDENGKKYVFTQIVPDCKKDTLIPIIKGKVELSATINADSWKSYDALVSVGYDKLFRVNHGKDEFVLRGEDGGIITINGMESFWGFTKKRLNKFNGTKKNFDLHLKECEWRWNQAPPGKSQSKQDLERYLFDLESDLWYLLNNYIKFLKDSVK